MPFFFFLGGGGMSSKSENVKEWTLLVKNRIPKLLYGCHNKEDHNKEDHNKDIKDAENFNKDDPYDHFCIFIVLVALSAHFKI